jgi:hypothetical protein
LLARKVDSSSSQENFGYFHLYMDLMGPTRTTSLGGRKYILVVVDDYSQFTWAILFQESLMLLILLNNYSREFRLSETTPYENLQ